MDILAFKGRSVTDRDKETQLCQFFQVCVRWTNFRVEIS